MQGLQTINSRYSEPLYSVGCLPTSKLARQPPTLYELNGTQAFIGIYGNACGNPGYFLPNHPGGFHFLYVGSTLAC